jgi:hypothetical protein
LISTLSISLEAATNAHKNNRAALHESRNGKDYMRC